MVLALKPSNYMKTDDKFKTEEGNGGRSRKKCGGCWENAERFLHLTVTFMMDRTKHVLSTHVVFAVSSGEQLLTC